MDLLPPVILFDTNIAVGLAILTLLTFLLNVRDCMLTDAVIKNGGYEANPLARLFLMNGIANPFRWAIKLAIAVGIFWAMWTFFPPAALAIGLIVFFSIMLWVVSHNTDVLARQEAFSNAGRKLNG